MSEWQPSLKVGPAAARALESEPVDQGHVASIDRKHVSAELEAAHDRNAVQRQAFSQRVAMRRLSMPDKDGYLGTLLGGLVVIAAAAFIFSGGQLGGVKKVESDKDLPPVASSVTGR